MKVHVTILHGKARQLNGNSLVLASEVAWVPCNLDSGLFNPRCCFLSNNKGFNPVDVNYKERNNTYSRISANRHLLTMSGPVLLS